MNTPSPPIKGDTIHTKEKILQAATDLIAQYGYRGASVRKIAQKVGIRESAIYNHFKNKEEIFQTILESLFTTPFDSRFEKVSMDEMALKGKRFLYEYAAAMKLVTFDTKQEKLFRIVMQELLQQERIREMFRQFFYEKNIKLLAQAFFAMMQNGMIKSSDPMLLAQEFFSPLFYWRLEVTLLRIDELSTQHLSTMFEKHVDFFWESVALK